MEIGGALGCGTTAPAPSKAGREQGVQRSGRCRDFIRKERGNVPEPFDPIVCREAEWASRLSVTKQRL